MNNRFSHFIEWHPLGQRIVKTSVAVALCLFFYMLRGYRGETMPAEAAITAIICMQPSLHNSTANALNRLSGTITGACWGFLFLLLIPRFPTLGRNRVILYLLMGFGTLISLYSTILIRQPDTASLAAIVFICVVIAYPDIEDPLDQAFHRILGVLVGNVIAILVNSITLPRKKNHDKLFFLPMTYMTANQFSQLSPAVLFRLQQLFRDGANICLISQHAPSFHISQLSHIKFTIPMIVMDGAAIFDANENTYITTTNIAPASCRWLIKRLESYSFFVYTIHKDRNCIYHHGQLTEREQIVYKHLKRSPYRYYLDDDHYSIQDVVYIKIVASGNEVDHLKRELEPMLEKMKLRCAVRPQAGLEDGWSLYIYAIHADIEHAKAHLMQLLKKKEPNLMMECRIEDISYGSEHDALRYLRKVRAEYEPNVLGAWLTDHK